MSHCATSATTLIATERALDFLRLRKEGKSYVEIGAQMDVSPQRAYQIVKKHMDKLREEVTEEAEACRQLDLDRLDSMIQAVWGSAKGGDTKACDTVLKIISQRSKLLGLEAPAKIQVDLDTMNLEQLREEARRRGIPVQEGEGNEHQEDQNRQPEEVIHDVEGQSLTHNPSN